MKKRSPIAVANEKVPIGDVLRMLGVDLADDIESSRSRKISCPFGPLNHSDRGLSPAMRIYPDTNSVYCFSCSAYFTPVSLAARAMDLTWNDAAARLLERIGYKPLDLAGAWKEAVEYTPAPNRSLMADALKTFCRRTAPDWDERQFEPPVASTLTRCLAILDLVSTAQDVHDWLTTCKTAMARVLQRKQPSVSEKFSVLLERQHPPERRHR